MERRNKILVAIFAAFAVVSLAGFYKRIEPGLGLAGAVLVPFVVAISILIFEKIKFKREIFKSPYSVFILLWT